MLSNSKAIKQCLQSLGFTIELDNKENIKAIKDIRNIVINKNTGSCVILDNLKENPEELKDFLVLFNGFIENTTHIKFILERIKAIGD
jgi:hypothetical protein